MLRWAPIIHLLFPWLNLSGPRANINSWDDLLLLRFHSKGVFGSSQRGRSHIGFVHTKTPLHLSPFWASVHTEETFLSTNGRSFSKTDFKVDVSECPFCVVMETVKVYAFENYVFFVMWPIQPNHCTTVVYTQQLLIVSPFFQLKTYTFSQFENKMNINII